MILPQTVKLKFQIEYRSPLSISNWSSIEVGSDGTGTCGRGWALFFVADGYLTSEIFQCSRQTPPILPSTASAGNVLFLLAHHIAGC
jgi:hypothetical protein